MIINNDFLKELKPGQLIYIKGKGLGVILYECKEPRDYWGVVLKPDEDKGMVIGRVHKSRIKLYRHFCWKCGHSPLLSNEHATCTECHWLICPKCGACSKPECEPDGVHIQKSLDFKEEIVEKFSSLDDDDDLPF